MEGLTQRERMINYLSNYIDNNKVIDMYEFADHMLKQFKKEIKIRKLVYDKHKLYQTKRWKS